MNSKSSRQQIQFPPLLNLANDRPHVDTSFKNWEENNAPYLNGMVSPVYIKDNGSAGMYDNKGRKHQIIGGTWYVDGVARQSDYNYKFRREVISDDFLACDIASDGNLFKVYYEATGKIKVVKEGVSTTTTTINDLANRENIIDIRIKAADDDATRFYVVVVYKTPAGLTKVAAIASNGTIVINEQIQWTKQIIGAAAPTFEHETDIGSIDPVINICYVSNYFHFSIFSNYGEAVNSRYNYYTTYYANNRIDYGNISGSIQYLKKVWYKGSAAGSYSMEWNQDIMCNDALTLHPGDDDNYNKACMWLYIDPSEASTAGMAIGWHRVYHTNSSVPLTVAGIEQNLNELRVDPNSLGTGNPPWQDWDAEEQIYATANNRCTICNTSGMAYGYIDNASVYWSWRNRYAPHKAKVNMSLAYNTDSNTLINPLNYRVDFIFRNDGVVSLPDQSTVTIDRDTATWTSTAGTNDSKYTTFMYTTDGDFEFELQTCKFYLPEDTVTGLNAYIDYTTRQSTTISASDLCCYPNVFLDNGNMYTIAGFTQSQSSMVTINRHVGVIAASGPYSLSVGVVNIGTITEMFDTSESGISGWTMRSNSFICQQNYIAQMFKMTQGTVTPQELAGGTTESTNAYNIEFYNSNVTDLKFQPGSSRYTGFNYYGDSIYRGSTTGAAEDRLIYCTIGARTKINPSDSTASFNILYNTTTDNSCYIQGISWTTNENNIGTLLTPWQEVAEDFYVAARSNQCVYKNKYGEFIKLIRVNATPILTPVNNNKFIICNTDNYWNMYDSERDTWFHYASDWNFRTLGGYEGLRSMASADNVNNTHKMFFATEYTFWFRNIAATVNNTIARVSSRTNYSNPNIYPVASWQTPYYSKARIYVDEMSFYGANEPDGNDVEAIGIDTYYTRYPNVATDGIGAAYYQYTYKNGTKKFQSNLSNSTYTTTSTSTMFLNPSLLATYLDGAGNNDLIKDLKEYYTQNYYNNKPTFIYAVSSEVNGADAFFVIQGQFYAIIENKICSVSYSDSVLTSKDPIIDINGMKFIGNNPMIAFFWSERYRSFYSFTGDANLDKIYDGSKFKDISGDYYYDYSTQTIYVPTSRGLLCFGPKNTYVLSRFKNTTNVQFTDDNITHITDDGYDYALVYYETQLYDVYPVYLESSFYGLGNTETSTIDRWNITLYDLEGNKPTGEIRVGVRSLTDITVKSEEKVFKITPDMWDKWSNSLLISYSPKLIKGQGIRLYVESPFIIQQITAHVADQGTGTVVNKRASV